MARRKAEFDIQANDRATTTLRRVSGETGKFERKLRGLKAAAGAALGVFATGAAVRGLARLTAEGLRSADSLGKQADRLGIAAKNLQAYRNAADLAGVSQTELEKGLGRLNRNIGDVKNGLITDSSPVFKAFEKLGVTLADLNSQSPEQVFERLVEKLGAIDDTATQGALAMQLFGRSGQQLLTLFNGGLEGIEESRKLLEDLGLSIDRIDAGKVEAANDAMTRLGQVSAAAKERLAVELAPAIEAIFTRLVETGREGETFGNRIASAVGGTVEVVTRLGSAVSLMWNSIQVTFGAVILTFTTAGQAVFGFAADMVEALGTRAPQGINSLLAATEDGLTKIKQGFADAATAVGNAFVGGMNQAIGAVEKLVNAAGSGIEKMTGALNALDPSIPKVGFSVGLGRASGFDRFPVERVGLGRVGTFGEGAASGLRGLSRSSGDLAAGAAGALSEDLRDLERAATGLFSAEGAELNRAFQEARRGAGALAGAIDGSSVTGEGTGSGSSSGGGGGAKGALDRLKKAAEQTGTAAGEALSAAAQAGQSVLGNLESAIDEFVRTGKLNFADFARSVIADLAKIQLKSALLGGSGDGSGGLVGAVLSGLTSSFTGGASYAGGGYTGPGARSGGLDGQGGFPAMLHPDETVIDHRKGGGMGGPVTISQTIEVRETLPEGIAREIVKKSQAAAVAAMEQINRRGGGRRQAFGLGTA